MTHQDDQQSIDRAVTAKLGMQQHADNQGNQLLKAHGLNVWFAAGLFIAVTILIMVLLFFIQTQLSNNKDVQSLLNAILASLAASLVFTGLYTIVVEGARRRSEQAARAAEVANLKQVNADIVIEASKALSEIVIKATEALSDQIEQRINKMLNEEVTRLVSAWPELLPEDYFPPMDESNPRFLEQLGKAVAESNRYIFRGATARFVPSLLQKYAPDGISCNILIIDPRGESAIRTYALNRYTGPGNNQTLEAFQQMVREEIYTAIVQLFDLRHQFNIEVRMCYDNLFYRSEIVDDGTFVSFYVGKHRTLYPPTYFYTEKKGGFYYSAFLKDFQQSWALAKEQFRMRTDMTESDLEDFLYKIGAGDKSELSEKITEWKTHKV